MRETEITVQVFNKKEEIFEKLKTAGFKQVEEFKMNDYYFSKYSIEEILSLDYENIIKNSFVVRHIVEADKSLVQIIFKDKKIDDKGNVISEEKVKCHADNLENLLKVFQLSNITRWIDLKQTLTIFQSDEFAFALQYVHGLGFFIEYEEDDSMADLSEQEKINLMLSNLKKIGLNLGLDYSCKKVYMKFLKENAQ